MPGPLVVPRRFNGPPTSGNGGYVCGLVATQIDGLAEVTLRSPPPLDTEMEVVATADGIEVRTDRTLVATARRVHPWEPSCHEPPSLEAARAARAHYRGHVTHEFPTCFTCGPARDDGLRIYPGAVGGGVVASAWFADRSLPSSNRALSTAIVWAALDCPGAWASARLEEGPIVLGRMAVMILEPVAPGKEYVSFGWTLRDEGRKTFAATALSDDSGRVLAVAKQTWIAL